MCQYLANPRMECIGKYEALMYSSCAVLTITTLQIIYHPLLYVFMYVRMYLAYCSNPMFQLI